MQPLAFTTALADIRSHEAIASARVAHVEAPAPRALREVTIRSARPEDAPALARLAQLDGRGAAVGADALVAVVGGDLVAARDTRGGDVSDPFGADEELVALLELRARQVAGGRFSRSRRTATPRGPRRPMPVLRVGGAR